MNHSRKIPGLVRTDKRAGSLQSLAACLDFDCPISALFGAQDQHGFAIEQRDMISTELGGKVVVSIADPGNGRGPGQPELHFVHCQRAKVPIRIDRLNQHITEIGAIGIQDGPIWREAQSHCGPELGGIPGTAHVSRVCA